MQSFVPSQETKKSMSHNESVVRAMIENAKASTPTENLENAAMAQQNFMLIQFDKSVAEDKRDQSFLQRIAKRSDEIRNNEKDVNDSE
jgi:GMP synthase-like glutamine amidotransferase